MKSTKNLAALIYLACFFSIFIFSCKSDELSRSEAENIVKDGSSKMEIKEFIIYSGSYSNGEPGVIELAKRLENLGLVKCDWFGSYADANGFKMGLTEKGKQYVVNGVTRDFTYYANCKVSALEFGGITGISQQKGSNVALVKFTQVRKTTPFGEAINLKDGPVEASVTLTKYDNGWRIGQ